MKKKTTPQPNYRIDSHGNPIPNTKPVASGETDYANDPDGQNDERASWADVAIQAFIKRTRTDKEDALCDLFCDIAHWCDLNDMSFQTELNRARYHYQAEAPNGSQFDDDEEQPELGQCITCGTQCVSGGEGSVLCPNEANHKQESKANES